MNLVVLIIGLIFEFFDFISNLIDKHFNKIIIALFLLYILI